MSKEKNMKEIKIKVEGKEWKDAIDKAYKKISSKVKVDGFRPGKAPRDMIIKKYGQGNLWMDAADESIQAAYSKVMDENKDLEIVCQPEVNVTSVSDDAIEFNFTLTLKPEVKLGKYKGLGVKKEEVKVSKKDIDEAVLAMQKRYAESVIKEGTVENGDTAVIDFEGFKDGVAFEGGKGENYSLEIGSGSFIPGFEEQLIGMKKGETKEINVTFPENYHAEELKGQPAIFKVTVNEIKTTKIPELDKDFFEDLGMEGIETEEALRKQLEENIKTRRESEFENKFIDDLLDAAVKNMEVEIPHVMIHEELDRMLRQYDENLKMQGITLEQFYQFTNSNEEQLKAEMHGEAEKRVLERLLLEEIVKSEKIEVKNEDVKKEAEDLAKKYQMDKDEFLKLFGGLEMVEYDLKMRKALDLLKANN